MQTLNKDIKTKNFHHMYLLYGSEPYLCHSFGVRLKEAMIGEDTMNYHYYEGKHIDFNEVKDMAQTMPFFADCRLIWISDSGLFKAASDEWVKFLEVVPESTCIVFAEQEVDKRSKMYKKVSSLGYAAELNRQTEGQLKRWILGILKQNQMAITYDAMDTLLSMAGDDMENIRNELEKLICYCTGKQGITRNDVEQLCIRQVENQIFQMIEFVALGKEKEALNLYYDLLALKEPSMRILFLVARQMNQLLSVKIMAAAGKSRDQIGATLNIKPFIVGKLMGQAKRFTEEQLKQYVILCVESEEAVKTGQMGDKIAVELVLVSIARR